MTQDFRKPGVFGETMVGKEAIKPLIRMKSQNENNHNLKFFSEVSGIDEDKLALNGWGYPIIPIPQIREGYGRIRLAPVGVSRAYLGHPIYWINPKLTAKRSGESWGEWSIRMFYLIDGFGYWAKSLEFVDFLKSKGFSFTDEQIQTYHMIASDRSETDKHKMLDEDDLEITMEGVEYYYNKALEDIYEMQKAESEAFINAQKTQYKFAINAITKETLRDFTANFDDPKSVWDKQFAKTLNELSELYDQRAKEGSTIVTDILEKVRTSVYPKLKLAIKKYNHASSVLELPVRASVGVYPGGAEFLAKVSSDMDLANTDDNLRLTVLKKIDELIEENIVNGNKGVGAFDEIAKEMKRQYERAWKRMRLAVVNLENMIRGDMVYSSYVELESAIQLENIENVSKITNTRSSREGNGEISFSDMESMLNISFKDERN